MDLFKEFGVDIVVVVKFDEEFARQSFEDFYKKYIIDGIGAAEVYEGPDHRFGRDREGDIETLKMLGAAISFFRSSARTRCSQRTSSRQFPCCGTSCIWVKSMRHQNCSAGRMQ